MATKSDFTPDQWRKILQSPLLVGFAVSAADPSGIIGTVQEGMASARALAAARADARADILIKAVVDDLLTAEGRTQAREDVRRLIQGVEMTEIKTRALEELRNTSKILDATTPLEAGPFKKWLMDIANKVAEAGTEGGLLGIGGEKVSAAERATLAEIAVAIGA